MAGHAIADIARKLFSESDNTRGRQMAIKRESCDIWFSKAVRLRDQKCLHCHKVENLECCHVFGRRNKRLRWAMSNAVSMCHYCHRMMTESPVTFHDWLRSMYGDDHMDHLRLVSNEIYKTTKLLRKDIAAHYRDEVRQKECDPDYEIQSWN